MKNLIIEFDTSLIKTGQWITKLLLFEDFNMASIGAAILNVSFYR